MPALADRPATVQEALALAEADAWFQYLENTQGLTGKRYREIEPWAWNKLQQRLRTVQTRRAKVKVA